MSIDAPSDAALAIASKAAELSDFEIVGQIIRGQLELFSVIVRRHNAELYRIGMAYLRNHAQAEDAMQNAYLKAFLGLSRFHGTAAFATWLTRIMINECLMIMRSPARLETRLLEEESILSAPSMSTPAIDSVHAHEVAALLEDSLAQLPPLHRAVFLLRERQQLSTAETAECLGLSEDNVKVCLHRARVALKAGLLKSADRAELLNYPATFCNPMTARVMEAVRAADLGALANSCSIKAEGNKSIFVTEDTEESTEITE